jgi:hypothetical protein
MCGPIVKGKKGKKGREGKREGGKKGDPGGCQVGGKTKYFHESSFHQFMFLWGRENKEVAFFLSSFVFI